MRCILLFAKGGESLDKNKEKEIVEFIRKVSRKNAFLVGTIAKQFGMNQYSLEKLMERKFKNLVKIPLYSRTYQTFVYVSKKVLKNAEKS